MPVEIPLNYKITAEGAAQALADIERVEAALRAEAAAQGQTNAAASAAATTTANTVRATAQATRASIDYRQVIQQLGQGFGVLNPAIGQVVGSVSGFTAAMGPAGIAVGALTVALPFLVDALSDSEDKLEDNERAAKETDQAYKDLALSTDALATKLRSLADVDERRRLVSIGMGDEADTAARLTEARQELANEVTRGNEAALRGAEFDRTRRTELEREITVLQNVVDAERELRAERAGGFGDAQAAADAEDAAAEAEEERRRRRAARGSGGSSRRSEGFGYVIPEDDLREILEGQEQEFAEFAEARIDATKSDEDAVTAIMRAAAEERAAIAASEFEARAQKAQEYSDFLREDEAEMARISKQHSDERKEMAMGFVGVADQAGQMLLEAFGATEGQKELWAGGIQLAEAVGSYPDPVGIASHALSAAMHFAMAADMGVGGGGSSAGTASVPPTPAASAPRDSGASSGGGTTNVTYNINQPLSEAQLGRLNQRHDRASNRRFGRVAT